MKYIELTAENAQILETLCDAVLKIQGMQMVAVVSRLIAQIKDSEVQDQNV